MAYAIEKNDLEKRFKMAIDTGNYHVTITIIDENGELICDTFSQGIQDVDVAELLLSKK